MGLWGLLAAIALVALLLGALWWRHAAHRRCPLDGGVRCPHCEHDK
jgi:hypothetical protein